MKQYEITLKAKGALTQVPDSQKLFGALVYLFAQWGSEEQATKLAKAVREKEIHIALSNLIPKDFLPTPQEYLIDKIAQEIAEKYDLIDKIAQKTAAGDDLKEIRKEIKARRYIKYDALKKVLEYPRECETLFPYITLQTRQQLRASIDSLHYDIPELDTKLYSVPTVELTKVSKDGSEPVTDFGFYLQMEETDETGLCDEFEKMLRQAVENKELLILGKRASQGMNTFAFSEITDPTTSQEGNLFLNLGMLLPDQIDFQASTLKLFTSERRPFDIPYGWSEQSDRYFISFLEEGSVVSVSNGIKNAGKCVKSEYNDRDVVFGNAFLYAIPGGKGGQA